MRLAKTLLEGEAGALTEKAVEMAIGGDGACLGIRLEHLLPVKKDSPIKTQVGQEAMLTTGFGMHYHWKM